MIDLILTIIAAICIAAGIFGCLLPVLPGPPIAYAGLILLQLTSYHPFSPTFLIVFLVLTIIVGVLDYVIPIYGTKKMQGSKYGVWGSAIGMIAGIMFLFPIGIIIGPMAGAFAGELLSGKNSRAAFKAALGSFLGFMTGTAIKIILTFSMFYFYITAVLDMKIPF